MSIPSSGISGETSAKITNMGLLSAFLVLFIHLPITGNDPFLRHFNWYFSRGIGKIAVPFFFVASGYLLAGHFIKNGWYRNVVSKRIRTLLCPMILWSLIYYFVLDNGILPLLQTLFSGQPWNGDLFPVPDWRTLARLFAIHPFVQPYLGVCWFIRSLFVLVVISPFLKRMAIPSGIVLAWMLNGLVHPDYGVVCTKTVFTLQEGFFSLFGASYFMLGIYLRTHSPEIRISHKLAFWGLTVSCLCIIARGSPWSPLWSRLMTWFYTPILLASIWTFCPSIRLPDFLRKAAFPVYVLHPFAIHSLFKAIYRQNDTMSLPGYLALGIGSFFICIIVAAILHWCFPRLSGVLFGGR